MSKENEPGYGDDCDGIADPRYEQQEELREWRGPFGPEVFDMQQATQAMKRGSDDETATQDVRDHEENGRAIITGP